MRPVRVLTAKQMRAVDRRTIDDIGLPSLVLMENAGRQVVAALESFIHELSSRRVVALCGTGNNGGDGFVVARTLYQHGVDVSVVLIGVAADVRGDARVNLDIIGRLGVPIVEVADAHTWELHATQVTSADLVIDAMMGTGLTRALTGVHETVIADLNSSPATVVSIDVPSGMSADTNELIGPAVRADVTVSLGAPKVPLVMPPAEHAAGDVVVADIGIPFSVIDEADGPRLYLLTRDYVRTLVPARGPEAHKGDFGRVVVAGGSRGMTGAAVLAARGALRSGAGRVTVATPASVQSIVAGLGVEFMTHGLLEADGVCRREAADEVLALGAEVLAVGPGLGTGSHVRAFVRHLLERCDVPLVLDADALNACAGDAAMVTGRADRPLIVTPHPGEMARLLGCSTGDVQANRLGLAVEFATTHHVYVVLKGYRTIIAQPDGQAFVNPTGTPGMATGGSGDVLTGMVASWVGQRLDPGPACQLAVYLHGAAGELAEADEGDVSMIAGDIVTHIGEALLELTARGGTALTDE